MLLTVALTFIVTSSLYGLAGFVVCRRIGGRLRGNSFAAGVVMDHVILPLLWWPWEGWSVAETTSPMEMDGESQRWMMAGSGSGDSPSSVATKGG